MTHQTMRFCRLSAEEIDAGAQVVFDAFNGYSEKSGMARIPDVKIVSDRLREYAEDTGIPGLLYGAFEEDVLVGFMLIRKLGIDEEAWEISMLSVPPARQGQGIGRRLGGKAVRFGYEAGKQLIQTVTAQCAECGVIAMGVEEVTAACIPGVAQQLAHAFVGNDGIVRHGVLMYLIAIKYGLLIQTMHLCIQRCCTAYSDFDAGEHFVIGSMNAVFYQGFLKGDSHAGIGVEEHSVKVPYQIDVFQRKTSFRPTILWNLSDCFPDMLRGAKDFFQPLAPLVI